MRVRGRPGHGLWWCCSAPRASGGPSASITITRTWVGMVSWSEEVTIARGFSRAIDPELPENVVT